MSGLSTRRVLPLLALASAGLMLAACAQESATPASSSSAPTSAAASAPASAAASSAASEAASSAAPVIDECTKENLTLLTPGTLTVGTDSPAYPPYYVDDDPTNGQGFESAVAYAVASKLGFTPTEVTWTVVPFNSSYAPGDKAFDFDINQISITPKRAKVVDFSGGYYTVNQAVVALKDSPIADATTIAELQAAKLGAQIGTTSLDYINDVVKPAEQPSVYNDTNDAKSALQNGQIDGIVVDLPTAYYIVAAELPKGHIVGQFKAEDTEQTGDQFGLLFAKGNPLVTCVNKALVELKESGALQAIQDEWLAGEAAPYFTE